ncbi:class I SAM-dependent methyltransferase [Thermovibrio sp.]
MNKNPFTGKRAKEYDKFFESETGKKIMLLEKEVILELLKGDKEKELLEIGCGTGIWIKTLKENGFKEPVGLDLSLDMLKEAKKKGIKRVVQGKAESLPFKDDSFSGSLFITSLEFIKGKREALKEAVRVSKEFILVAFLNRNSLMNAIRLIRGIFRETVYSQGELLTKGELLKLIKNLRESTPWSLKLEKFKTTLNLSTDNFVNLKLEKRLNLPTGAFAAAKFRVIKRNGTGKGNRV